MIQFLVTAVSNAAIYALVAVSLNVVYRSSGILNFGAGYMVAIAGIFYVNEMSADIVGIVLTMLVAVLLSVVAYFASTWWGQRTKLDHVALSLALLGFGMVLDFVAGRVWATEGYSADAMIDGTLTIGDTTFATERVLAVLLAAVFIAGVLVFVDRTMAGNALEATAADSELAGMYGVRTGVVACVAWALAGGAIGLAGILQSSISAVSMDNALPLVIYGIAAAVVGGLGSIRNAVVGALAVAGVQAAFSQFISPRYSVSMVFVLLFLVLALRPAGLFVNARNAERV
ncbi:branched-chain amino acid ABC transporter permease [Nocardia sp. NPDC049190]|uniref:branched-chain amino acid ABC transporter permease n=1 Tax=Nocardia sp. NPDC049190 TaxID=3155650 RepID=UPI0033F7A2CF